MYQPPAGQVGFQFPFDLNGDKNNPWDSWVAQWVQRQTLDLCSGLDFGILNSEFWVWALHWAQCWVLGIEPTSNKPKDS